MSKKPEVTRPMHDTAQAPPGWHVLASVQVDGKGLAIQWDEFLVGLLDHQMADLLIHRFADSLYEIRPDLRKQ